MRKAISVLFLSLLLTVIFVSWLRIQPGKADPSTLIVPDEYPTIQEAVDAAISGDTILVKEGTYYENVVIYRKNNLTIIGENRKAIVNGNGGGAAFSILGLPTWDSEEDLIVGVKVSGFTITNSTFGIYMCNTLDINITDDTITGCNTGVFFDSDHYHGSQWSLGNVYDSLIYDCGIAVYDCPLVRNNTIAMNDLGIYLGEQIAENTIEFNLVGVYAAWGSYVNNTLLNNFLCAVHFDYEDWYESGGPYFPDSIFVGNNFVNNTSDASVDNEVGLGNVAWDGGYSVGGNYWSNYSGLDFFRGPYQNLTGSDGIGDYAYYVLEGSRDNYPFMEPLLLLLQPLPSIQLTPKARFVNSPISPVVNESVEFDASWTKDLDGEIIAYAWDFGDGTRLIETDPTSTHFFNETGSYNVSLLVIDDDGLNDTVTNQINVGKMPSEITGLADPQEITIRENTTISGAIAPKRPNANVTVWCRFESEDWNMLTTVTTDMNSEYEYVWMPSRTGFYALRASWEGDEFTLSNESTVVAFSCLNISSSISIATSSASTFVGYKVNVTGILEDMYGVPVSNETVVLYYTFSGISTWTPITSDKTDNAGGYSAMWIPPATGDFVIKAEWVGNATHSETNSIIALSALSFENQYVFSVESNSTVSDLAFDTENSKLSFTATGPDGTSGYTRVTIAKTLFPDITDLKVRVDDVEYNYTVADVSESWVITFTYNHSVHIVEIDLGTEPIPELTSPLILLLFITTLLAVIIYKRKRIF